MRIKNLTIHGFKSFVDKVSLNMSPGASGIIGPNGCGKSNIVDAIRWVIGEQNPRHLRGKQMEDVIFNGSEVRKPTGFAEVVLTFSNDEGKAPGRFAGFTEIEVARRLYRSGESEYYLNKVQCRLRDIVDLFTDTGIGTRAYSIVEQGQVGWLINAKPEERRVLFEEAAGIAKYRHKKEAAIRKLEATKGNLTRVNDIISEVKRQLNSLDRQARKAEKYKALREELKAVELQLASMEVARIRSESAALSRRLETIRDEETENHAATARKEAAAEELKIGYSGEEALLGGVRESLHLLEKEIQGEERSSALLLMRADELERNEARIAAEMEELASRAVALAEALEAARAAIASTAASVEDVTARSAEASGIVEGIGARLKEREEADRGLKAAIVALGARGSDLRHAIQMCLREEEALRQKEAAASAGKDDVLRTLSSREAPVSMLRERLGAGAASMEAIAAELAALRARLDETAAAVEASNEELKAIEDEKARAAARLSALEAMEKNLENVTGGARSIMLKGAGSGVHGLMADVIEANPGFERAVEAVLGDRLQYVIVESQKEGIEAVEYLKSGSLGRASFLPVRDARPSPSLVAADPSAASYGNARELLSEVRVKDGYERVVGILLGDVLVADDLASAREIWGSDGFFGKTIVTLDGDVLDERGVITGGAGGPESGILKNKNEVKALRASVGELEGGAAGVSARLASLNALLEETKAGAEAARERLHAAEIEGVNLASELKRHEEETDRLRASLKRFDSEIAEASARFADLSVKRNALGAERDAVEAEAAAREAEAAAFAGEIAALAAEKERAAGAAVELKVELAHLKERVGSLRKEAADKEALLAEAAGRREARALEMESGRVEMAEKRAEAVEARKRIESLLLKAEETRGEERQRAEALAALQERLKEGEAELRGLKAALAEMQELKGELTVDMKEMELTLKHLNERMMERYAVALSEVEAAAEAVSGEPVDEAALNARRQETAEKIEALGTVSLSALDEYRELEGRHSFLLDQQGDLAKSVEALQSAITRINRTTREMFKGAFEEINARFQATFPRFFNGGRAELRLSEEGDVLESGIEIVAQPPGKKLQNIVLLSGGEKALTATSLIFAIFLIKPSPFCLLDEVDAPLDDANIDRFNLFVKEMSALSQFILITHNKKTMEMADTLYGVTMEEPGVSKVISVKF